MSYTTIRNYFTLGIVLAAAQSSLAQTTPPPAPQTPAPQTQTPQTPAPAVVQDDNYQLGPGDTGTVAVLNHVEFSGDFVVPDGGVIVLPEVGDINVNGMTLSHLRDLLTIKLKKQLLHPRVAVILKMARTRAVTLSGDVQKPGAVPYINGLKLADLYNASGGLLPGLNMTDAQVTIVSRDGTKKVASLREILSGTGDANIVLRDGDYVTVDTGLFTVYVGGQVAKPGAAELKKGGGVLQALAMCGGAMTSGAISKTRLDHADHTSEVIDLTPELVHGEKGNLPSLMPGDVITVPVSTDQFSVLGYVGQPGLFPIPQGQVLTLSDAISTAKGHDLNHRARLSHVVVQSSRNGKVVQHTYDVTRFWSKGDTTQNPEIYAGDVVFVPETNQVNPALVLAGIGSFGLFYNAVK